MATFGDLKAYVDADGWAEEPNLARQRRRTGDHWRHARRLPDGRLLRTKVSHALLDEIGPDLFRRIPQDQLGVDEAVFWAVIRGARAEQAPPSARPSPIPAWLVHRLLHTVGLPDDEIARMTPEEAQAAWDDHRMREQP